MEKTKTTKGTPSPAKEPLNALGSKAADGFDGLDPLSMFAAQEATSKKIPTAMVAQPKRELVR